MSPWEQTEKRFLRHEPCPQCGSKNNIAVYWNEKLKGETYWCYTCESGKSDKDLAKEKSSIKLPELIELPAKVLKKFGLSADVARDYRIGIEPGTKKFYFVYDKPGTREVYDAKVRNYEIPKDEDYHFFFVEGKRERILYGMGTIRTKKHLLLVEGEWDAPCAKMMLPEDWVVLSIPTGAKGSLKTLKHCYEDVIAFDDIVVCFDNDEDGVKWANTCVNFLGYKARLASLPAIAWGEGKITKDAKDFLQAGLSEQFSLFVLNAPVRAPSFIMSRDEEIEEITNFLFDDKQRTGYSTGLGKLDSIVGGFRQAEVTILFGDPASGKSTLGRHFLIALLAQKIRTLYITLEERPGVAKTRLIEMKSGLELIKSKLPDGSCGISPAEIPALVDDVSDILMTTYRGAISMKDLSQAIEYGAKAKDVKFVLFDHITAATDMSGDMQQIEIRKMLSELNTLALNLKIHICIISHTRRDTAPKSKYAPDVPSVRVPTIRDAFGSSSHEQYGHLIMAVTRDAYGTRLYVIKNRLYGDINWLQLTFDKGEFTDGWEIPEQCRNGKRSEDRQQHRDESNGEVFMATEECKEVCTLPTSPEDNLSSGLPVSRSGDVPTAEHVLPGDNMETGFPGHQDSTNTVDRDKRGDGRELHDEVRAIPETVPQTKLYSADSIRTSRPPHPTRKEAILLGMDGENGDTVDEPTEIYDL